jgi:choline dehydrogenase-like flavoprotein
MQWDAIVIGSGFGGALAAHALVNAGHRVLMLERGTWVSRGPENWLDSGVGLITPHFSMDSPYQVTTAKGRFKAGAWNCVGGQSVFYGGASYRFRERDFEAHPDLVADSGAEWPVRYDDMEPFYGAAERLLGVAGETGIAAAAARLGMTPTRIPLAISYDGVANRRGCVRCGNCDGYACANESKNDIATAILPELVRQGMVVRPNTVCVRLVRHGSRITGVECVDRVTGERSTIKAPQIVLAAGALATPHLLLASNLAGVNPAGSAVGRYLTRHRNAVVFGVFASRTNPEQTFAKQVALFDFYNDAGCIQQMTPAPGLVRAYFNRYMRRFGVMLVERATGLLVIAEDQPKRDNGVDVDWSTMDRFGLPGLRVSHHYSRRDEAAAKMLVGRAKEVMREAGALFTITHQIDTFSHALGTVRMGLNDRSAPLDEYGRFRGLDNLYVVDGSALPRSAGVNPSLTIAANALRIGAYLSRTTTPDRGRSYRSLPVHHDTPIAKQ